MDCADPGERRLMVDHQLNTEPAVVGLRFI